jgi:hypothetical protein
MWSRLDDKDVLRSMPLWPWCIAWAMAQNVAVYVRLAALRIRLMVSA